MTPRTGLYVALVGLVIAVLCGVAALIIPELANGPPENRWENINTTGVVLVYFGLFIGFILMLVGLALAVARAMMKPS
jgi:hypothetical protein